MRLRSRTTEPGPGTSELVEGRNRDAGVGPPSSADDGNAMRHRKLQDIGSLVKVGVQANPSAIGGLGGGAAASHGRPLLRASPWARRGADLPGPVVSRGEPAVRLRAKWSVVQDKLDRQGFLRRVFCGGWTMED